MAATGLRTPARIDWRVQSPRFWRGVRVGKEHPGYFLPESPLL